MSPSISFQPDSALAKIPGIFTIVDVETTGMRAASSRVIDIGIIRIENGIVTKTFKSFVNPGSRISWSSTLITGITNDDVENAPSFEDISSDIYEFFENAVFVAHNASFDYSFIKAEFARCGIDFSAETLCTVKLSRALYPRERRHNLDAVIERFGFTCETRHRAYPDADVLRQFLEHIQMHHTETEINSAISGILFAGKKEFLYDRKSLSRLPDGHGIYQFYGPDNELLYIGKSKHIRTRVRSHFSDDEPMERKLMKKVAKIECEETAGELSALILEAHRIKRDLPIHNRKLRKLREMVALVESKNAGGYLVPVIEKHETIDPQAGILSVFRSMPQARAKLREFAAKNNLCEKLLGLEKTDRACFGFGLGKCSGACIGRESADEYNKRFKAVFKSRRIKTWPFKDTIMIDEKKDDQSGIVFFVRDWRILKSFSYEGSEMGEFIASPGTFDVDTYKILARYMLDPANRRSVKQISEQEFRNSLQALDEGEYVIEFA
ncbi:MAG: hypothetical protein JWM20_552 [Patescibacteria group bacterium]|nr:hypothetical protein [Patescibacteria group bacterium]